MNILARGIEGMPESPVLKELNDIRQLLETDAKSRGEVSQWDMTTQTKEDFWKIAQAVLPEGKYNNKDIADAYNQLTLISEFGGSHAPHRRLIPSPATRGNNVGKYLVQDIQADPLTRAIDDNRSRESVAAAMYGNWSMLPVRDSWETKRDTAVALKNIVASTAPNKSGGHGIYQLGNSGFRHAKEAGSKELREASIQNTNDTGRGFDRLSRDLTVNQSREFGHDEPIEGGGADISDNGRMQAMSANKATRDKVGAQGALRAFGPNYKKNKQYINERLAGQIFGY
jgi:hypothetical protein